MYARDVTSTDIQAAATAAAYHEMSVVNDVGRLLEALRRFVELRRHPQRDLIQYFSLNIKLRLPL